MNHDSDIYLIPPIDSGKSLVTRPRFFITITADYMNSLVELYGASDFLLTTSATETENIEMECSDFYAAGR